MFVLVCERFLAREDVKDRWCEISFSWWFYFLDLVQSIFACTEREGKDGVL